VQLTYEQYLIEKNREKAIRTSSPDADTDYEKINWYNDTKKSFANKDLDDGVKEIRNTFKLYGNVMLQQKRERNLLCLLFRQNTFVERKGIEASEYFYYTFRNY